MENRLPTKYGYDNRELVGEEIRKQFCNKSKELKLLIDLIKINESGHMIDLRELEFNFSLYLMDDRSCPDTAKID